MGDPLPPLEPEIYAHLRAMAGRVYASNSSGGDTLQPTALLHEAWMKLANSASRYNSRAHFFAVASRAMRQILVDRARQRLTAKRGSGGRRTTLAGLWTEPGVKVDVLDLDRALTELEAVDPAAAQVVQLRAFGGLTVPEVAEATGTSPRTVDRTWRFARAFLITQMQ